MERCADVPLWKTDKGDEMKKLILLFCMFSAAGLLTSAPRHSGAGDDSGIEQKLMQMERDWAQATLKKDSEGLNRFESDYYVYNIDGMTGTKKDDLADAKNGDFTADSIDVMDMTVHVFGDAAVVTGKTTLKNGKYKGKDITGTYLFTDTWVRKGGHWQVVASHASKMQSM
jgi:ketosteroid isomerase-like protein